MFVMSPQIERTSRKDCRSAFFSFMSTSIAQYDISLSLFEVMVIGEMRHVRAFLPKTCQLTTYRWKKPDGERFAQVRSRPLLTCEGKCSCWRAKPAHFVGHLPAISMSNRFLLVNSANLRTNQTQGSEIGLEVGTGTRISLPMSLYREYTV